MVAVIDSGGVNQYDIGCMVSSLVDLGLLDKCSLLGAWADPKGFCLAITRAREQDSRPGLVRTVRDGRSRRALAAELIQDIDSPLGLEPLSRATLNDAMTASRPQFGFEPAALTYPLGEGGPLPDYRGETWAATTLPRVALLWSDSTSPLLGIWQKAPDRLSVCVASSGSKFPANLGEADPWGTGHQWQLLVYDIMSNGNFANPWSPWYAGQVLSHLRELSPLYLQDRRVDSPEDFFGDSVYAPGFGFDEFDESLVASFVQILPEMRTSS